MPKTVKLVGAFFVPLLVVLLVGCGQNSGLGDSTFPTPTEGNSASPSPTVNNMPLPLRTDVAQVDLPQPEETVIARATQAVIAATAEVENATRTAIAVGTKQAYMRRTPTVPPTEEVGQGDFGTWRYKAHKRYAYNYDFQLTGKIYAEIGLDTTTLEKLFAYAKANQVLADQLADKGGWGEARITFRTFVEPDQFRSWVKAHGLDVVYSTVRITEVAGGQTKDRTISIGGYGEDSVNPESLKSMLGPLGPRDSNGLPAGGGEGEGAGETKYIMKGVFFTLVRVPDVQQLPILAADPLVFISDVSINAVRSELVAAGVPGAEFAQSAEGMSPFFADMEYKYGLDKFQK